MNVKPNLPLRWRIAMLILTCLCSFGNHWSNSLIVALKTTILSQMKINNSQFATLVAVTNLINTFLCISIGVLIDKYGGAPLSLVLATFHLAGSAVMAAGATNGLNSYNVLIVGKVLAAIGDGSLDNAQHRIFASYFGRGEGFAFSIGAIWSVANLGQFTGQSTANVITRNLGSYAWALWISAAVALFSVLCAVAVLVMDKSLRRTYHIIDHTGNSARARFSFGQLKRLGGTFWIVVLFAVFENAGVQSFVSISTQLAQQRLKKGTVIAGWVSSMYLLVPIFLTPLLGIFTDLHGQRVTMLFMSGVLFLVSMLLLKLAHSTSTFIASYVFYALAQAATPAPQVEIVRSLVNGKAFGTAFAIKKSVVQASIVIITTAAGRIQDLTPSHTDLDPALNLWIAYAAASVAIAGLLLLWSIFTRGTAHKAQHRKDVALDEKTEASGGLGWPLLLSGVVIILGWIMFGLGVGWGVHGNVIAGTTGE